jgi:hypothetical protein
MPAGKRSPHRKPPASKHEPTWPAHAPNCPKTTTGDAPTEAHANHHALPVAILDTKNA